MKKVIIIILGVILFIPCIVDAKINHTKSDAITKSSSTISQYVESSKYLITKSGIPFGYKLDESEGVLYNDSHYKKAGFLNLYEYTITGGRNSYLFDGGKYWMMTNKDSSNTYVVSSEGEEDLYNTDETGIRATVYINNQALVEGTGSYSNPWYFIGLKSSLVSFNLGNVSGSFPDNMSGMSGPFALSRSMEYGEQLYVPNPTSSEYTFLNWTISPSNTTFVDNWFTMGETNVSFTANWEPTAYKLTIDLGEYGGYFTDTTYQVEQKIRPNTSVTIPTPLSEDYNFVRWELQTDTTATMTGSTIKMNKSDATVKAVWKAKTYTLAFALGTGGEFSDANTRSGLALARNATYDVTNTPIRKGYIFNGWTVTAGNSSISGNTITMGNQATTITANWTQMIYNYDHAEYSQTFTAPIAGYYQLEAWGAQGKDNETGVYRKHSYVGGYGGYSVGAVWLNANQTIYITVGSSGDCSESYSGDGRRFGGYNGGGYVDQPISSCGDCRNCTGGGATHIATSSGTLNNFSSNYSTQVYIVAGGGGGIHRHWNAQNSGGPGGGYVGRSGIEVFNQYANCKVPTGGSQTAAGSGYNYSGRNGSFGVGGAVVSQVNTAGGSGGGGLFGGGSGGHGDSCANAGAGGSGYIANSLLLSRYTNLTANKVVKSMYCYECSGNSSTSTYTVSTYNVNSTATSYYAKTYNGYARISYLSAQ